MVYVDQIKNYKHDSGEQIIAQASWADYRNVQLDNSVPPAINFDATSGKRTIAFQPNLIPVQNTPGFASGRVKLTNSNSRKAEVVINESGNISLRWN